MNKILFVDTFTTGMSYERCGIYKIGGIFTEDGKETARFELRMRPYSGARIYDESLAVGGEKRSTLVNYQSESEAHQKFMDILNKQVDVRNPLDKIYIAGYNAAAFDSVFMRAWFLRNYHNGFRNYFHVQALDLMCLSAFVLQDERNALANFQLDTVANALGAEGSENDGDCIANAEACRRLYNRLGERYGTFCQVSEDNPTELINNY